MRKSPSWPVGSAATQAVTDGAWLPGAAHMAAALATGLVFGGQACVAGLVLATLASFVVYLPLTALALNGWQPIGQDDPAPELTARAHFVLLVLWTVTAWLGAAAGGLV